MFFARAAEKDINDSAGTQEGGEIGSVALEVQDVNREVQVDGRSTKIDLAKEKDAFDTVLSELAKTKKKDDDAVGAKVSIGASLGLSGKSPVGVATAVKTTSFLFEQLLNDLEAMARMNQFDKTSAETQEVVESFHTHMASALERFGTQNQSLRQIGDDLVSSEDVLTVDAEKYIASINKLVKQNNDNTTVSVWYRDVKYDAHVPLDDGNETQTIGTILYGATCGLVQSCYESVMGTRATQASHDGYERLENGMRVKKVLKNLTGRLQHSRLTLVIGPPGCGKTSYLRAIAGLSHKQRGVNAKISGEIRYNHLLVEELKNLNNWSTYVSQTDSHLPLLTVRETLEFAWKCRKGARVKNEKLWTAIGTKIGVEAAERLRALTEVDVEFVLAVLGLSNCADTIIGNATLKGVSGGEKRRVTLGEMLVTGAQVCCLDEISTGLDSAATYDICKYLRACAHFLGQVIAVALLQPPPEVVELFDDIVLLAEGNVIYHGPRENVLEYFEKIGYRCPPRKDLGDFLAELPTPSGVDFLLPANERPSGKIPRTADEFGTAWKQSQEGLQLAELVNKDAQIFFEKGETLAQSNDPVEKLTMDDMPENSFIDEFFIVLRLYWSLRLRNKAQIMAKVFQNIIMGLIFGTLFYQIDKEEWYLKAMLFGQMPSFMQSGTIGNINQMVEERAIFYKQHEARFYSGITFSLVQFTCQIPFTIFDAMVFGNLLYWMCGLVPDPYRYAMFMLLSFLFGTSANEMMRVFAYSQRTQSGAFVMAVMFYLMFIIFSGQVATPKVIPDYMVWIFWMNPYAWVYRALAINEFKDDYYGKSTDTTCTLGKNMVVPERCGDYYLKARQFETSEDYVSGAVILLIGFICFWQILTMLCLTYIFYDRDYTDGEANDASAATVAPTDGSDLEAQQQQQRRNIGFGRTESLAVNLKTLVFSDLWYTINLGKSSDSEANTVDLLKGVNGWALPGRMTALMGSSGAGKTTLLDVLADRKTTGTIRGHILINSAPPDPKTFKRIVGYVEQFGVHCESATVHESLLFSAELRLPPQAAHRVESFVQETMELLELESIADELTRNLSVEENKRLTIAVELVANPSILFADEPTSGLDARAAQIVMRGIQNVARSGRTVICTIHQPSIAVFTMFDDLLLMRRGGKVVFFGELGENSKKLIEYFESIPGTRPCPVGYNPATWMLEVIGAGTGSAAGQVDYAAIYSKSKLCQRNMERLKYEFMAPESADMPLQEASYLSSALTTRGDDAVDGFGGTMGSSSRALFSPTTTDGTGNLDDLTTPLKRKMYQRRQQSMIQKRKEEALTKPDTVSSFSKQFHLLMKRNLTIYWRSPDFSLSRMIVILIVACIITAIFWQQEYHEAAEVQSRISCLSFLVMLAGAYNLFTIMPFSIQKRALFYREVSSGMYSKLAAVATDGIVELPYLIVETIIGVNIVYWGVGFKNDVETWLYYSVVFFEYISLMTLLGMLFAALMPDPLSAQLVASLVMQIFQIFSGVIVPKDKLPSYYKWLYYVSAQMWAQEGLISTQFHGDENIICNPFGEPVLNFPNKSVHVCTPHGTIQEVLRKDVVGIYSTAEEYVLGGEHVQGFLGYQFDNRFYDVMLLFIWIVVVRFLTARIVMTIDHNKR